MLPQSKMRNRLALVLSGGGARGAYEAGVIHYIRNKLKPKDGAERVFEVQCGSSVGAINTCFMAAHAQSPKAQGKKIYDVWKNLRREHIYKRNIGALGSLAGRTTKSMASNLLKIYSKGEKAHKAYAHFKGFLDTEPLPAFLKSIIPFRNIRKNISSRRLAAVTVTATNISTGRMELFIQKRPNVQYTGDYTHSLTEMTAEHVRASASMPLIFPAVKIKNTYYTDGGLKLNTPMSPAIQLGASHIMLIGSHHFYKPGERLMYTTPPSESPSLGQMVGQVMNALFLDRLRYDIEQLARINRIIEWSEKVYGPNYIDEINAMLHQEGVRGDIADRGLKKIKLFHIYPSRDVSELFAECYEKGGGEEGAFSTYERVLLRIMDIDPNAGVDILSYLGFIPVYLKRLLELGYEDAAAHHDELVAFLTAD